MPSTPANARIPKAQRLYGRKQDRPLKPRQQRLMRELLPRVSVPIIHGEAGEAARLDLEALFPDRREIWFEIGFGGGEHLAWQAERNPNVGMIGAEPFVNGVAKLLVQIDERGLDNIRIHHGDARPLLEALPPESIDRLFVLHPDPWPKKRHWKRRIINAEFLQAAARALKDCGELRVASDIPGYIRWTLRHLFRHPDFEWTAERPADWRDRAPDWPETRYAAKAQAQGRTPIYLSFRRAPRDPLSAGTVSGAKRRG